MKQLAPSPKFQALNNNGLPMYGGRVYTYEAGSSTPAITWTDRSGSQENSNPVELDGRGEADVWLSGDVQYKFVLKDPNDVTIWTVDYVASNYIYGDDITWTGHHTFLGGVTFGSPIDGDVTWTGNVVFDGDIQVTGNTTLDGTVTVEVLVADEVQTPLITLADGDTISVTTDVITITGKKNIVVITDNDGTPHTFDHREDGTLRLPIDGVDDLDAATVGQVNDAIAARTPLGLLPVAIGSVVSDTLISGSIGVTSVTHTAPGTYEILLDDPAASTAKLLCFTQIWNEDPILVANYTAMPFIVAVDQIRVQTGGGNSYSVSDQDFQFVVYSLP